MGFCICVYYELAFYLFISELKNKPIGFLYDLRKGINDAFDKYSDDGKPLPPAIIDFEKRARLFDDKKK
jgi:hypothetical protein